MNTEVKYIHLASQGLPISHSLRTRHHLYYTNDHLMQVTTNATRENYQRFYFKDIEALQYTETDRSINLNLILIIFLVSGIIFAGVIGSINILILSIFTTFFCVGIPLLLLILNFVRGLTCNASIITKVQVVSLPSLSRIKSTRKTLKIIEPIIRAAQHEWPEIPQGKVISKIFQPPPLPDQRLFRKTPTQKHPRVESNMARLERESWSQDDDNRLF